MQPPYPPHPPAQQPPVQPNDPRMQRMLRKVAWQTGHTIDVIDVKRQALPPGMRISKNGKRYYENRANRSDKNGTI